MVQANGCAAAEIQASGDMRLFVLVLVAFLLSFSLFFSATGMDKDAGVRDHELNPVGMRVEHHAVIKSNNQEEARAVFWHKERKCPLLFYFDFCSLFISLLLLSFAAGLDTEAFFVIDPC